MVTVVALLIGTACGCGLVLPFAFTDVVNAAIIAGIFSVINTALNGTLIIMLRHARKDVQHAAAVTEEARAVTQEVKNVADTVKLRRPDAEGYREIDVRDEVD